jgi:hypothetical protein
LSEIELTRIIYYSWLVVSTTDPSAIVEQWARVVSERDCCIIGIAPKRKRAKRIINSDERIKGNSRPADDEAAFAFAAEDLAAPDVALLCVQPILSECSVVEVIVP